MDILDNMYLLPHCLGERRKLLPCKLNYDNRFDL